MHIDPSWMTNYTFPIQLGGQVVLSGMMTPSYLVQVRQGEPRASTLGPSSSRQPPISSQFQSACRVSAKYGNCAAGITMIKGYCAKIALLEHFPVGLLCSGWWLQGMTSGDSLNT